MSYMFVNSGGPRTEGTTISTSRYLTCLTITSSQRGRVESSSTSAEGEPNRHELCRGSATPPPGSLSKG